MPLDRARVDHAAVDRIQHNDAVGRHPQGGRGVDPVAFPSLPPELGVDLFGVIAALAGDDHLQVLQQAEIVGVSQRRGVKAEFRSGTPDIGGGEKLRFKTGEVLFLLHAPHEDRAHHPAPSDKTDSQHLFLPEFSFSALPLHSRRLRPAY